MKDRIIQFLKVNNLTSTKFADIIGVQRSSISHILSGRNKPSFDFIEKMLIAYPDIDAQWLITGKGQMQVEQTSLFNHNIEESKDFLTQRELNIQNDINNNADLLHSEVETKSVKEIVPISNSESKDIERVIIFFKDGSFKDYKYDK